MGMSEEVQAALDTLRHARGDALAPAHRDALDVLARELERLEQENAQVLRNIKAEAVQTIQAKEYGSDQFHRADAERARADRLAEALAHSNRPGPYCKGGSLICDVCVGSCGEEEHAELVESVLAEHGSPEEARP